MPILVDDIVHLVFEVLSSPLGLDDNIANFDDVFERWYGNPADTSAYNSTEQEAKGALAACALVSREWAQLVRPYLFQVVALRFTSYGDIPRRLEDIEEWIQSSQTVVRGSVRKLRLVMLPMPRDWQAVRRRAEQAGRPTLPDRSWCEFDTLANILDHFTNLQVLELFDVQTKYDLQTPIKAPRPLNLHRFHYHNWSNNLYGPNDLLYYLSWLHNVDTVYLAAHTLPDDLENAQADGSLIVPTHLRARVLDMRFLTNLYSTAFIAALLQAPAFASPCIKALSLTGEMPYHDLPLSLLHSVASSLVSLYLGSEDLLGLETARDASLYDLFNFPHLKRLTLEVDVGWGAWPSHTAEYWKYYADILSQLVPRNHRAAPVDTIILDADLQPINNSIPLILKGCSASFSQMDRDMMAVPTLQHVYFTSQRREFPYTAQDERLIAAALPRLHASGKLGFKQIQFR